MLHHLQERGRIQCCGWRRHAGDAGSGGEAEDGEAEPEPRPAAEYMVGELRLRESRDVDTES